MLGVCDLSKLYLRTIKLWEGALGANFPCTVPGGKNLQKHISTNERENLKCFYEMPIPPNFRGRFRHKNSLKSEK